MKTYIYKVTPSSPIRGYNRTIEVYRVKNNKPIYLGEDDHINTASYKGDRATALQAVAEFEGYKFKGYDIVRKDIQIFEV